MLPRGSADRSDRPRHWHEISGCAGGPARQELGYVRLNNQRLAENAQATRQAVALEPESKSPLARRRSGAKKNCFSARIIATFRHVKLNDEFDSQTDGKESLLRNR